MSLPPAVFLAPQLSAPHSIVASALPDDKNDLQRVPAGFMREVLKVTVPPGSVTGNARPTGKDNA